MNSKSKTINMNEYKNLLKGKEYETKNIIKLINNQYSNSLKNPFSNLMIRKTIIHNRIKVINRFKNLKTQKKGNQTKVFKQNNLYINFLDLCEKNKRNKNRNDNNNINNFNNTKIGNSLDENFPNNFSNNEFSSNKKLFKRRNIKPLKLLSTSKTINNLKAKCYSKEYSDKKIVFINNKMLQINRMNITIDNLPKIIQLEDKTIQTVRRFLPKIEESKIYNKLNNGNKIIIYRNKRIRNNINSFKTDQISTYLKDSPKKLFKNRTNNDIIIKSNEENYKSISVERIKNNHLFKDINSHKGNINSLWKKVKNDNKSLGINSFSNELIKYKNNRINIFTLLSLNDKKPK